MTHFEPASTNYKGRCFSWKGTGWLVGILHHQSLHDATYCRNTADGAWLLLRLRDAYLEKEVKRDKENQDRL